MALLEFKEAEDALALLDNERQMVERELRGLASALDKIPDQIIPTFKENYLKLSPDSVYELLCKLRDAKIRLAEAAEKKIQFGL